MKNSKWIALLAGSFSIACAANTTNKTTNLASASSCGQLADSQQTLQQLYSPGSLYAAKPIRKKVFKARAYQPTKTFGASLFARAEPGMTGPYMERVLRCHASFGQPMHPNDPLHPSEGRITRLSVDGAKGGFAINIQSDQTGTGEEIWQRARSISGGGTNVQVDQVGAADASETTF